MTWISREIRDDDDDDDDDNAEDVYVCVRLNSVVVT